MGTFLPSRDTIILVLDMDIPFWLFKMYYEARPVLEWFVPFGALFTIYLLLAKTKAPKETQPSQSLGASQ